MTKVLFVAVALLIGNVQPALSWSCSGPPLEEVLKRFQEAKHIYVVNYRGLDEPAEPGKPGDRKFRAKVIDVLKGSLKKGSEVWIYFKSYNNDEGERRRCGYIDYHAHGKVKENKKFLLSDLGEFSDLYLNQSGFHGPLELRKKSVEAIRALNKGASIEEVKKLWQEQKP